MRMRKKKNLDQRIKAANKLILCALREHNEVKSNDFKTVKKIIKSIKTPIHLEIGCGKGGFINILAERNPDINFIALEKSQNVIVTALEKTLANPNISNIMYIIGMAEYLDSVFGERLVDVIYLNFSCPYPKNSYSSRRLTHSRFLEVYKKILKPGGIIKFKTDNLNFFEFSLKSFSKNGFGIKSLSRDLHNSDIKGNVISEYEAFFMSKNQKINYLEVFLY
ncbi:MAG: tRNA (guanosine(46)-N7)-methyltransferase TrmB [Eubacterium sp.]|nr:tRNA (guanosine(46)-N7)-methyltransferase TrmB [Eubacterium sp.]